MAKKKGFLKRALSALRKNGDEEPKRAEIVKADSPIEDEEAPKPSKYQIGFAEHDPRTDSRQVIAHTTPPKLAALLADGEMGTDLPKPLEAVKSLKEMLPALVSGHATEETALVLRTHVADVQQVIEDYARVLHDKEVELEHHEDLRKEGLRNANADVRAAQDRAHRAARELKQATEALSELAALVGVKLVNVGPDGSESGSVDPVSKREEIVLRVTAMARASRETEDRIADLQAKVKDRETRIGELEDLLAEKREPYEREGG